MGTERVRPLRQRLLVFVELDREDLNVLHAGLVAFPSFDLYTKRSKLAFDMRQSLESAWLTDCAGIVSGLQRHARSTLGSLRHAHAHRLRTLSRARAEIGEELAYGKPCYDIKPAKTTGSSLDRAALAKPRAPSDKTERAADEDAVRSENVGRISSKGDTPLVSPSGAKTEADVYPPTIDRALFHPRPAARRRTRWPKPLMPRSRSTTRRHRE